MKLKPILRRVHLVLALAASLPLVVLAVTGALLVFPTWLDETTTGIDHQARPLGSRLTPTQIVKAMDGALPTGERATRIVFPSDERGVVTATSTAGRRIVLDPYTGNVLGISSERGSVHSTILRLHVSLLAGEAGRWITGLSALATCLLCLTGIYLWWPLGRFSGSYFLTRWTAGWRRLNFDLHRHTGFYACCLLFVVALSGAAMAFYEQAAAIVSLATWSASGEDRPFSVPVPARPTMISPDEAVALARSRAPGEQLLRLYVPTEPGRPYRVFLNPPASFEARYHETRLVIDPYRGTIIHEDSPRTRSRADAAMMWILPLHLGTVGGTPLRAVYVFISLSPVLLGATGAAIWWARRNKQRRARAFVKEAESTHAVRSSAPREAIVADAAEAA
jgi:uncharacterized iron-regulated membrane protein